MATQPLVAHAVTARARAGLTNDPDLIAATKADLAEAKALAALDRAGLTSEQRERVGVALLTDSVQDWLQRTLAEAPRNLDPATRAKVARLLAGGEPK